MDRKIPRHIAIIMDGNGRWAKAQGLPRTAGHKKGADTIRTIARQADWVVTVEEHQITGGLGSAVAEALCDLPDVRQLRMGIPDEYPHIVGSHEYLCDYYGLRADKIAEKILSVMGMQP